MSPMIGMKCQPLWQGWMAAWVHWDEHDQAFVGSCPDQDEICREKDPAKFLMLFEEASREWEEQESQHQKDCGLR